MQQASQGAAQATGELVAQQNLRDVAQQIPGAVESGDFSQLAASAYGAGDPTILREVMQQQSAREKSAGKPSDKPLSGQLLRDAFPGMTDNWYKAAEMATSREQQRQEFAIVGSQKDRDEDRFLRRESQYEASRDKFTKSLESNLKKYRENLEAFDKLSQLDPMTNIGFWPQVSTIIKKVGMDAGALSDQDMSRFITATGQRTATQALQYLGAIDPSKTNVPPETIKAVTDVIAKMKNFSESKLKERAQIELKKQAKVRGDRVPDDLIKEAALEYGFVADKKNGDWQFGDEITTNKISARTEGNTGSEVQELLGRLDPKTQESAKAAIARFAQAKKPIPSEFVEKLRQLAGGK